MFFSNFAGKYLFQCPEGLVPLSNRHMNFLRIFERRTGFNAPKGWYLFLTTFDQFGSYKALLDTNRGVSMPRRAGTSF